MAEVASGGSDAVAVHIEDLNPNWVSSIKGKIPPEPKKIKSSSASKSCSIHRVPSWRRIKNSAAYDPKVISIGPLHYEKRKGDLQGMEEHKWKYLHDIFNRKHEDEGWLEDCLAAVKGLEEEARNCYSEAILLDSYSFVEMMVLDGCFILELFRRDLNNDDDVISELDWLKQAIYFDLLLMENQIPFFILKRLSDLIDPSGPSPPLVLKGALKFLISDDPTLLSRINDSNICHLLHLLHTVYGLGDAYTQPTEEIPQIDCASKLEDSDEDSGEIPQIACASKLEESGIKFRKRDVRDRDFLDIKFDKGVIEIPARQVWDKIEIKFLNLIAFEQCYHLHCRTYVTTYCHFMDCLINTAKDVDILCREGIIDNHLGNDELLASHFNSMVTGARKYKKYFYLSDVCGKINEYSQRRWPRMRASLVHDYFNNPWAIISFIAAVLLLFLTITQTFFSSFPKFAAG